MYNLVPAYVLFLLVFSPLIVPLTVMGLASLYHKAREVFFGISESDVNVTLPVLLEMAKHQEQPTASSG